MNGYVRQNVSIKYLLGKLARILFEYFKILYIHTYIYKEENTIFVKFPN